MNFGIISANGFICFNQINTFFPYEKTNDLTLLLILIAKIIELAGP